MHPLIAVLGILFIPFLTILGVALGLSIGYAIYGDKYNSFKEFLKDTFLQKGERWKKSK